MLLGVTWLYRAGKLIDKDVQIEKEIGRNYNRLIKEILGDSPAGKYLRSMEDHSKYVDEQRRKHAIDNSPKVVAEKRFINIFVRCTYDASPMYTIVKKLD